MSIFRGGFPPSLDQYHLTVELLLLGFWYPNFCAFPSSSWAHNLSNQAVITSKLYLSMCVSAKPCQRPRSELRPALQLDVSPTPPACWLQAAAQLPQLLHRCTVGADPWEAPLQLWPGSFGCTVHRASLYRQSLLSPLLVGCRVSTAGS